MRISNITARDLPEAWFLVVKEILQHGRTYTIDKGSYEGQQRKQLDFMMLHIQNPGNRPLVPPVPDGIPAPSSDDYVDSYMSYLFDSRLAPNETYRYAQSIERQVYPIIDRLLTYGFNNNQTYITVGSPDSIDLDDPECLRGIDLRILDGKLNMFVYFRSWDAWAGLPTNLAGLQRWKEWLGRELDVGDGEIIAMSKGIHLYNFSWGIANTLHGLEE